MRQTIDELKLELINKANRREEDIDGWLDGELTVYNSIISLINYGKKHGKKEEEILEDIKRKLKGMLEQCQWVVNLNMEDDNILNTMSAIKELQYNI